MKTKDVELPTAGDVMVSRVVALSPDTTIAEAVDTLVARGYSGAPVVDRDGRSASPRREREPLGD